MTALHSQEDLLETIRQEIEAIPLKHQPDELYQPIAYFLNKGGKRLRPLLLLMACDVFNGNIKTALPAALAIELFHNFTLVHDDIMDRADLRRGSPTIHKKFGPEAAILSGDLMMVMAYQYLNRSPVFVRPKVLELFNNTATKVCEGQQYDINYEEQATVDIQGYLNMIELKTAALIAGSLAIGSVVGGADEEDVNHIHKFGIEAGIAFQLQDDILDTFGHKAQTGKQVGGDILMNKKTYLLLKAFELADQQAEHQLRQLLFSQQIGPEQKVQQVRTIYQQLNVKEEAESLKQRYLTASFQHLDDLSVSPVRLQPLKKMAQQLANRKK